MKKGRDYENIKERVEANRICQNCGACHNPFAFRDHPVTRDGKIVRCVKCKPRQLIDTER